MTVSPYASDAKISEALTAIGAELVGQTEQQLLQQILVAAATANSSGPTTPPTFASITGSPTDNTNLAAALNAKLNLTGGTLTGAICMPEQAGSAIGDMRSTGFVFGSSAASAATGIGAYAGNLWFWSYSSVAAVINNNQLGLPSAGVIGWGSSSAAAGKDTLLGRGGAATLQLGQNHASTPTAQTIKAHNVTTGTGADMSIRGGSGSIADGFVRLGTATGGLAFFGTGGSVQYQGDIDTNVTSSGSGDNVLVDTQFDGGSGNSYTIGGIIKALKAYGILG